MKTLRLHSVGPEVQALQEALREHKFSPGVVDGFFGPATRSAVMNFQANARLLVDGVAGPRTQAALGLIEQAALPSVIRVTTPNVVSRCFAGTPIKNIRANLPYVLRALEECGLVDEMMVCMAIATVRAETGHFLPITEYVSKWNTSPEGQRSGAFFDLYDFRQDIGNNAVGDGRKFCGRGYIQLTGQSNYRKYGKRLGIDLVNEPERANEPEIAGRLLAMFLDDRETRIKQALIAGDYAGARRLVNGGSHGLTEFTATYKAASAAFERFTESVTGIGMQARADAGADAGAHLLTH